jgi:hypothetical protein
MVVEVAEIDRVGAPVLERDRALDVAARGIAMAKCAGPPV